MRKDELRFAGIVGGRAALGMLACAAVIWGACALDYRQMQGGTEGVAWLVAFVLIPTIVLGVVLFVVLLHTLLKAILAAVGALLPERGYMRRYFDADAKKSGDLRENVEAWARAWSWVRTSSQWGPPFLLEMVKRGPTALLGLLKSIATFLLVVVGLVGCTALVFGGVSTVLSWPTWAVVIVVLLVLNLGKK